MKHFSKWMLWVHWDAGRCEAETVSERMKGHGLNNCYWNLYVSHYFRNVQTININYDELFVLWQTMGVVIAFWCVFERVLSMKCNWFRSISLLFASNYCKCMCISKIFDWRTTIMALSLFLVTFPFFVYPIRTCDIVRHAPRGMSDRNMRTKLPRSKMHHSKNQIKTISLLDEW